MSRRVLIDTDPGCDDALALMLAFASPEIEVAGITTVMGNSTVEQTTRNALKICELVGRTDVPVHAGCALALLQKLEKAEVVHGADAMAELDLPLPSMRAGAGHAVDFIIASIMAAPPNALTLCAIGPLTNIALAIAQERQIATRLAEIVIMGGAFFAGGNSTAVGEYNIWSDPHAARIVWESGARITLCPLDMTHKNLATPQRIAMLGAKGGRLSGIAADILTFYSRYDVEKMGLEGGPIHDPCVIAWLVAPHLFNFKDVHVTIETMSATTLGMTVMDWWGVNKLPPNTRVLTDLDSDGFYSLLADRIATL